MNGTRTRRAAVPRVSFRLAIEQATRSLVDRWRARPRARAAAAKLEALEGRTLLAAADPIISEFLADNTTGLTDGNGNRGDWIEIYNPGTTDVNLQGWHLTDSINNPTEYTFPSFVVPAGGYKVVFATGEATPFIDPGGYPHTNFSLSKGGEYLALSRPDGTITTDFAPSYPPQTSNVSYGFGPGGGTATTLLSSGAAGKTLTPTSGSLGSTWTSRTFNDSTWTSATTGIGYEANTSNVPALTQEAEGNNDITSANNATTSFAPYTGNLYQLGFNGTISSATDSDYFKIGALQAGDVITLTASGNGASALSDPVLELYRGNGATTLVTSDDNSGPGNDALIHRLSIAAADTYYVRIRANASLTGDYRVGIRLENSGTSPGTGANITAESEPNDSGAATDDLSNAWDAVNFQSHIAGGTNFGTSHDWFKYQFTAGDVVTVYVDSTSAADGTVVLRDASGNALASEDGTSAPPSPYDKDSFVYSFVIPSTGVYYVDTIRQTTSGAYALDVYLSTTTPPPHPANFAGQYNTSVQSDMFNKNASNYLRVGFNVTNPGNITALDLKINYDDGFVAYLNGTEVARRNAPGSAGTPIAYNAAATTDRTPAQALTAEDIDISAFRNLLVAGNNVLAIQGLNSSAGSDDFLIVPQITADVSSNGVKQYFYVPTPGAANVPGAGVVINEIHYNPDLKTQLVEFIELFNNSNQSVDVSGWRFTKGVTYTFPAGSVLAPGQYAVLAQDAGQFQSKFGFAPFGVYTGSLSNDGEQVTLTDPLSNVVDTVTYGAGFPWPTVGDALTVNGTGPSIQLINPGLDNDLGGDWRSALPTPGAKNSVFAGNAAPAIRQVSNSPTQPTSGQPVTVTAKVTDPDGVAQVNLQYQVNAPGAYIPSMIVNTSNFTASPNPAYNQGWVTLAMYDDGTHGDATPNDGTYTAQIPAGVNQNRTLIRYRVAATDGQGANITAPYADDPQLNFAYYVYDGVPGWSGAIHPGDADPTKSQVVNYSAADMNRLPVYQLIARNQDVIDAQHIPPSTASGYSGSQELWRGTMVYNGVVYDNIGFRARGGTAWRYAMGKNKWEFNFNRNHAFQAYDNYGNPYPVKWDNFALSGIIQQGNYWHRGEQGMFEAATFKFFNLAGVPADDTSWTQFRVVDDAAESTSNQYQGDLWGMYLTIEQNDGTFLEEHDLPDGNYYRMNPEDGGAGGGTLNNQGPYPQPSDNSDLVNFTNTYKNTTPTDDWWRQNLNLDEYYAYRTIVEAVHHYDVDQGAGKNYFYYHNPVTNQWEVHPWDVDLTWSDNMFGGGDEPFKSRVLPRPAFNLEYKNAIRNIRDLLWNTDQAYSVLESLANVIDPPGVTNAPVDYDRAMWDYNPILDPATGYTYGDKGGVGRFYAGGPGVTIPAPGGFRGMVQKMKNYVVTRAAYLDSLDADSLIPNKPSITYTGPADHPLDQLSFHTSNFSSPNNNSTFSSMEWRIAEVYDPNNPIYSPTAERPYEIQANWQSPELTTFNANMSGIPAGNLIAGHSYRVRVRMKDANGRWSNWSDPIQFIGGEADSSIQSLRITEIMYSPAPPPAGSPYTPDDFEYLELQNTSGGNLDLSGVKLSNGVDFTFPDGFVLGAGQRTLVVSNLDAFQSRYGHAQDSLIAGTYTGHLADGGERLRLEGPAGQQILDFSYNNGWYPQTDGQGFSLVIINPSGDPNTWGDKDSWRASQPPNGAPGQADPGLNPNAIVVNEISANPTDPTKAFVELKNTSNAAIDISNWFLSDSSDSLTKYRFTPGTILQAGGYLTLNQNTTFGTGSGGFTLSPTGGTLYITSADGSATLLGYRDAQDYEASDPNVTQGRYIKSTGNQDFVRMVSSTPGADNSQPVVGPIVITEVMYNPQPGGNEYIEFRNVTDAPVDISGWRLQGVTFTFPAGTIIPAHAYFLVVAIPPGDFRTSYNVPAATQVFGPFAGVLDDAGEDIELTKPGPAQSGVTPYITVDRVSYSSSFPWPTSPNGTGAALFRASQSAYGNDVVNWRASAGIGGTPGRPNAPATATARYDITTALPKLSITFTEDVSGTLTANSLSLQNLSGGSTPATAYAWDPATLTAIWTFSQIPADGNYRATLNAVGVVDWSGVQIDGNGDGQAGGNLTQDFFYLGGDVNQDRHVDFNDLVVLAQNYNSTGGKAWAQGDFSGDGNVDFNDLVILAQRYNTTLPTAGAPVSAGPVSAAAFSALFAAASEPNPKPPTTTAAPPPTTGTPPTPPAPVTKKAQPKPPLPVVPPAKPQPPAKKPAFSKARIR
ncbi:MAG TPA: lamin tail domain-containing protein [Tepidisphaeraceae bacterium]